MNAVSWIVGMGVGLGCTLGGFLVSCAGSDDSGVDDPVSTTTTHVGGSAAGGGGSAGNGGLGGVTGGAGGVGGYAGGGGAGGAPCSDFGDACSVCEHAQCSDVYCGCVASDDCVAVATCLMGCASDNAACIQACWTAHPDGISGAALMQQCAATTCAASCGNFLVLSDCEVCLFQSCDSEMNACMADADCAVLLQCVGLCTTPLCRDDCVAANPDGAILGASVLGCGDLSCDAECGFSG